MVNEFERRVAEGARRRQRDADEFERRIAEGERRWQKDELRRSGNRRPFLESWWWLGLMSLQAWPRVVSVLIDHEPSRDRVQAAVIFSLLFLLLVPFWVHARRSGARRREALCKELELERESD